MKRFQRNAIFAVTLSALVGLIASCASPEGPQPAPMSAPPSGSPSQEPPEGARLAAAPKTREPVFTPQAEQVTSQADIGSTNLGPQPLPALPAVPALPQALTNQPPGQTNTTQIDRQQRLREYLENNTPLPPGMSAPPQAQSNAAGQSTQAPATPPAIPSPAQPGAEAEPVAGATPQSPEPLYDLAALGMELDQFFDLYSRVSGRTVIRPYVLQGAPQGITLVSQSGLTREEAIFAMDAVLALNTISMIPLGDKFVKAVPTTLAAQEGGPVMSEEDASYELADQFVTQVVKLKSIAPTDMVPLLTTFTRQPNGVTAFDNNQTIVLRDTAMNVQRMMDVIARVDVETDPLYSLEVIPIKYGKVTDIYNTMNGLINNTGGVAFGGTSAGGVPTGGGFGGGGGFGTGVGASRASSRYGSSSSRYGGSSSRYGGGGYGGNYGGGYYPQEAAQPLRLNSEENLGELFFPQQAAAAPAQRQNTFQNRLNQIVRNAAEEGEVQVLEDARIVPDERSNTLLVFASPRDMEMITNMVNKVDVLLAQVLIEAIIMEVKLNDSLNLGVSMLQQPQQFGSDFAGGGGINNGQPFLNNLTNFSGGLPSGLSYFGRVGDDLDVTATAIARDSSINIISKPRIQTSHAIPGTFVIGETVPYVTGVVDYGGFNTGIGSRANIQEKLVALELYVTPYITPEGLVVMEIEQIFDQRGPDVMIDGNPIPIVNARNASAVLTVRDGDTIMLGGFVSENKNKGKSGVPILKDIPLLGALFRSSNKSTDRTELIVLLRASVLESPADAAVVAAKEKTQLPGIQQAEQEYEEDDAKRRKKFERRLR